MVTVPNCGQPVDRVRLIHASGAIDARGSDFFPAAMLVRNGRIVAVDRPEAIGHVDALVETCDGLLIPGLVNAHTHLDLSDVGIWPAAGSDFRGWVGRVRSLRMGRTDQQAHMAVERGIELSLAGGTSLIGDIAGHPAEASIETLRASSLEGVSFVEVFGIGQGESGAVEAMRKACDRWPADDRGVHVGLSPHAPYSCSRGVFEEAASMGRRVTTHLAETPAELELLASGTGPLRAMLEADIGVWSDAVEVPACHPVDHLGDVLGSCQALCAHANWLESAHIDRIAQTQMCVVYCPRASAAFGHAPPALSTHPWQALRALGVSVCLGTDSLLCLDTPDRISVLDEMRLLASRDGIDPRVLLEMATIEGARSLGRQADEVCLGPQCQGVLLLKASGDSTDALLASALSNDSAPEWVLAPHKGLSQALNS